ncbi:MAG: D-glycero-beta-D-manno-heptose 1-phosphate adenylyltransferase [Bacteroidota bacterium]
MTTLERTHSKILSGAELDRMIAFWRFKNKSIVFTNGCFDLIHPGHIEYLSAAKDLGDILVVGINTDQSVRRLKGPSRPLMDEKSRVLAIASFSFISAAVLFDEDTPAVLISRIMPDVLVKGADYKTEEIAGADIVINNGGRVETIALTEGYSTSAIIEKIQVLK